MKVIVGLLLVCWGLCAVDTKDSSNTADGAPATTSVNEILTHGLEMVLAKLEQIERKMELHFELHEPGEVLERNRASHEKTFEDFLWAIHRLEDSIAKDVARNTSLLQNQSLLIQTACTNHEQFRKKWFNFTSEGNEPQYNKGVSWLENSRISDFVTTTAEPRKEEKAAPSTTTTTTTTTTPTPKLVAYSSCKNTSSNVSRVYLIRVNNDSSPFKVYCEMEKFGGGWIVVQHRFDGSVDFYRNWTQYRDGFGELDKEFWLGLEQIHQITTARAHELVIEMKDFTGSYGYARYNAFQVSSESEEYELKNLGSYVGTAGDSLAYHKWMKFSTKDRDNDPRSDLHLATLYDGAWWYGIVNYSNLNGRYQSADDKKSNWWSYFKRDLRGLSFTRMMIREL